MPTLLWYHTNHTGVSLQALFCNVAVATTVVITFQNKQCVHSQKRCVQFQAMRLLHQAMRLLQGAKSYATQRFGNPTIQIKGLEFLAVFRAYGLGFKNNAHFVGFLGAGILVLCNHHRGLH